MVVIIFLMKKKEIIFEHFDAMLKFHGPHGAIMFLENYYTLTQKVIQNNEFRDIVKQNLWYWCYARSILTFKHMIQKLFG